MSIQVIDVNSRQQLFSILKKSKNVTIDSYGHFKFETEDGNLFDSNNLTVKTFKSYYDSKQQFRFKMMKTVLRFERRVKICDKWEWSKITSDYFKKLKLLQNGEEFTHILFTTSKAPHLFRAVEI